MTPLHTTLAELWKAFDLYYIDLFCGAGGTSTGVNDSRIDGRKCARVVACVNHDPNAIASHAANHPDARHYTEDMRTLDLGEIAGLVAAIRRVNPAARIVLWASLECTNHSKAKGGKSRDADSRTLADHLFRYVEAIDPDYIQIENVEEFLIWGPLIVKEVHDKKTGVSYCPLEIKTVGKGKKARKEPCPVWIPQPDRKGEFYNRWVEQMKALGYKYEHRILNAADFGAHTTRRRYFGQFARRDLPIVWPEPTHAREGGDLYTPLKPWKAVREVLDLHEEGESIFDRKTKSGKDKTPAENTLKRIYAGLVKFVAGNERQWLIKYNSINGNSGRHVPPGIHEPCPTVTCQGRLGLASAEFLVKNYSGHPASKCISLDGPAGTITTADSHSYITTYYGSGQNIYPITQPSPTVTTKDRMALVTPFVASYYSGGGQLSAISDPCPALTTVPKQRLVFVNQHFGRSGPASADQPLGALTTKDKYSAVFIDRQYGPSKPSSIEDPLGTITTNPKNAYVTCREESIRLPSFIRPTAEGLVYEIYETDLPVLKQIKLFMAAYGLVDVRMRMLNIPELKRIQGLPSDYVLIGTQTEQKKFLGNAVERNTAQALCEALARKVHELRQAA